MFVKFDQQLKRCDRVIRQRIRPHIHPVISHLKVESYEIAGEPIPADEFLSKARSGEITFQPFNVGSLWGTTWGTTWFKLTGTLPHEENIPDNLKKRPVELTLDLGWYDHSVGGHIEGMLYRPDGRVIKAVHPRAYWPRIVTADGTALIDTDEKGNFTLYLEAACNPLLLGVPPFIATDLGEKATGKTEEQYQFRAADVTIFDERFEDYWLDLDVVSSLMRELDPKSPRYCKLGKALQRSLNTFDEQDLDSVVAARAHLSGVLSQPASSSAMTMGAIGHAHIDSAWLWPVRETQRKVCRTVANVLALMDEDPDFRYAMSSAQQYQWLEQSRPDLWKRMQQRIREGRFIPVGGMWVESDGMLPAGESLIRQLSYGNRYFAQKLGVKPHGVWLPDSFGYTQAWPQIARRAGYSWFLTQKISWNDTTKFPYHSFLWEGLDGSQIFTHFPPADTYAASVTAQELAYSEKNFKNKDLSSLALMLFGYGDGGGGPTREMMGRVRRFADLEGMPRVQMMDPDVFFAQAEQEMRENAEINTVIDSPDELTVEADNGEHFREGEQVSEMPVYKGELYLELHRATLTSQQEMKRLCRMEESLLRTAEYLFTAASLLVPGYRYPTEEMDRIWQALLLNQFHDILPGSAIAWVHRQAREQYAKDIARLRELIADVTRLLEHTDAGFAPGLAPGQVSGTAEASGASRGLAQVKNAHISPADWVVRALEPGDGVEIGGVEGDSVSDGVAHSTDVTHSTGHGSSSPMQSEKLSVERTADGMLHISGGLLDATIAADGSITSLIDVTHQRELVAQGYHLGTYEMLKDEPTEWDAWNIDRDAFLREVQISGGTITAVRELEGGRRVEVASDVTFSHSSIHTLITFCAHSPVVDFALRVEWHEKDRFLKMRMPLAISTSQAQFDSQYGIVTGPVRKNSESQEAGYEHCSQRFVRVAEGDYALAVLNNSTYGCDVSEIDSTGVRSQGTLIRTSLVSSPVFPDPHTDEGEHVYHFQLLANASVEATVQTAANLNAVGVDELPGLAPLIRLVGEEGKPSQSVMLDWVKMADDGSGDVIARVYEPLGRQAQAKLELADVLATAQVREVGILENNEVPADLPVSISRDYQAAQLATLHLQPFEMATLRFRRG